MVEVHPLAKVSFVSSDKCKKKCQNGCHVETLYVFNLKTFAAGPYSRY